MNLRSVLSRLRRRIPRPMAARAVDTSFTVSEEGEKSEARVRTLGTFGGVFTPSFLTIIGVIMYLRFGWILSNAGLYRTLAIVLIANCITLITALSVSSIATNMRMESGGAYYIISRVLGPPAGGSLGISLFFSQAISIALYTIGFCEALSVYLPGIPIRTLTLIALGVLTLLSVIGAGFMIRIQYIIMAAILLSLVSIFIAFRVGTPCLAPNYTGGNTFWTVFAVFFPAVTGLLAGVSMSGDLKKPERSIPTGILTAIGSILAAPRTLQALAYDGIAPKFLGFGVGRTQEPLAALLVSIIIAAAAIFFGNLNAVAGILTMFFLTTYGVLNLSAVFEKVVGNPSFRPAIKVPWPVSLLGALGCVVVMFLIDRVFTLAAWVFIGLVFTLLSRRSLKQDYGDIWEGFWRYLMLLGSRKLKTLEKSTGKNWSPLIQVFATDEEAHGSIRRFASDLARNHGLFSVYTIIEGSLGRLNRKIRDDAAGELTETPKEETPPVFTKKIIVNDFREGVLAASQAEGFGAGSYNTVLLGLPVNTRRDRENALLLRNLSFVDKNILILKRSDPYWIEKDGPIIVWWGGMENNARLMLILADLLQKADTAYKREIYLKSIIRDPAVLDTVEDLLVTTIGDLRIHAVPEVLLAAPKEEIPQTIAKHSRDAALVCLGLAVPDPHKLRQFFTDLRRYADTLPPVPFVRNNSSDIRYE